MNVYFKQARHERDGFTLIEVMLALTLTLLMMLALARAFKLIGLRIGESQSELTLSADLREITKRLRLELAPNQLTADPNGEPNDSSGYFHYYEGPMTNETTTHVSLAKPFDIDNPDYVQRSRFGDLDDIVSFTAKAPPSRDGSRGQFMGFIPRGVLAAHEFQQARQLVPTFTYSLPGGGVYTKADAIELVPFYSDTAEIIYWLSPSWSKSDGGIIQYEANSGQPLYRDNDGDQLPDRMDLHRRVLLIRDDLNMSVFDATQANTGTGTTNNVSDFLPFLEVDSGGTTSSQRITPLSTDSFSGGNGTSAVNIFDTAGSFPDAPGNWHAAQDAVAPSWLTGMASLHQVMDLSIARLTDSWSAPNNWNFDNYNAIDATRPPPSTTFNAELQPTNANSFYGMPSRYVQANSLASLSSPENRFGFVRMPDGLLGPPPTVASDSSVTSSRRLSTMPIMALCPPHPFMVLAEQIQFDDSLATNDPVQFNDQTPQPDVPANSSQQPGIVRDLPSQADPDGYSGDRSIGDPTVNPLQRYGRFTMVGFLRPEFNLQDRIPNGTSSPTTVNRGRSDVIASNILSFDAKVFDPDAPSYVFVGGDNRPGTDIDDDGDNVEVDTSVSGRVIVEDFDELGLPGSDDELVLLNDLNVRRALNFPDAYVPITGQGAFVDLHYGHLAGHPLGDTLTTAIPFATAMVAPRTLSERGIASSRFSGISNVGSVGIFTPSLQHSGRVIIRRVGSPPVLDASGNALVNSFAQPGFDTFTQAYRTDLFDQEGKIHAFARDIDAGSTDGSGVPDGDPEPDVVDDFGIENYLYTLQRDAGDGTGNNVANNRAVAIRRWSNFVSGGPAPGPNLEIRTSAVDTTGATPANRDFAYDVSSPTGNHEPEGRMKALQITIRLYDVGADQIRQQTIVQKF